VIPGTVDRLTAQECARWSLWLHACEHRAVLPWVRTAIRLAQTVEDGDLWTALVEREAELQAQLTALEAQLWDLDPAWAQEALGRFYAQHPDGTPDPTRRLR
jgi:hypothetical protein